MKLRWSFSWLDLSLIGLIIVLISWCLYIQPWRLLQADLSTTADEQVTVLLLDGTQMSVAGNSMADINVDLIQRHISLIEGQFDIETSALCVSNLTMVLETPQGILQPGDSRFSVALGDDDVELTVHKGSVTLHNQGQEYVVAENSRIRFTRDDITPAPL